MTHQKIATFNLIIFCKALKLTWTHRRNPNGRRGHESRHTPAAVGLRYGRSVGQILRRLERERALA